MTPSGQLRTAIKRHVRPGLYGCKLWTGETRKDGTPIMHMDGGHVEVWAVVFMLSKGDRIMRRAEPTCGVRSCVNPRHLQPVNGKSHRPKKQPVTTSMDRAFDRAMTRREVGE